MFAQRLLTLTCSLLFASLFLLPAPTEAPKQAETAAAQATAGAAARSKPTTPSMERVTAGNAYPLSAVVHIETQFPSGAVYFGSGTMIDRYHVLTAGHVVFDAREGGTGFASQIKVFAGETGSVNPFDVAYATYMRTFQSFMADDKASKNGNHVEGDGDIGLITLDRPLGTRTGWYGFNYARDDSFFVGRTLNTAGYPAAEGYDGHQMYRQHGTLLRVAPGTSAAFGAIEWDTRVMTAIPGQSGSGIYDYDVATDSRIVYAVLDLNDKARGLGFGERITKEVYDGLQQWIAQDNLG